MEIDVFTVPSEAEEIEIRGQSVVVIDVLRTSSSILQAFAHGCREVYPVESIERALNLHSALFTSDILLCGERDGVKIAGFHLGNSPIEYTRETVANKSLIFTSTNGTKALIKTRNTKEAYICGFQNIDLVAETVLHSDETLKILCAGQDNHFSLEDVVCAGMLIERINGLKGEDVVLSDAAGMALLMYDNHKTDLHAMIRESGHGRSLILLNMEGDLDFCVTTNSIPLLPQYIEGKIRLCRQPKKT